MASCFRPSLYDRYILTEDRDGRFDLCILGVMVYMYQYMFFFCCVPTTGIVFVQSHLPGYKSN